MTMSITVTGSVNYEHFVEIANKSNQGDIVTLSSNGKELRLTAGRSLCDRFIIMLNSTCLGTIGFIKAIYKKLEHREAQAVKSFCKAINDIYEERSKNIVKSDIESKTQLVVADISNTLDKIKINSINYEKCLEKDKKISFLITENGFADFSMSQLNHSDSDLLSDLNNRVDELMENTIERKSFCDDFKSVLKTALVDFVTAMPASSYKFMDTIAGKNISGFNTAEEKYKKNEVNIHGEVDPNFTTEDFEQISEGAAIIKAQLIDTDKYDQYRHRLYAALFYKFYKMPPQVHINAAASENTTQQQPPATLQNTQTRQAITGSGTANVNNSEQDRKPDITVPGNIAPPPSLLQQVYTDTTEQEDIETSLLPESDQPHGINPAALQNTPKRLDETQDTKSILQSTLTERRRGITGSTKSPDKPKMPPPPPPSPSPSPSPTTPEAAVPASKSLATSPLSKEEDEQSHQLTFQEELQAKLASRKKTQESPVEPPVKPSKTEDPLTTSIRKNIDNIAVQQNQEFESNPKSDSDSDSDSDSNWIQE